MTKITLKKVGQYNGIVAFYAERNWGFKDFVSSDGVLLVADSCSSLIDVCENLYVGLESSEPNLLLCKSALFNKIVKAVDQFNTQKAYSKTVFFLYDGGSKEGYRKIGVTEEDSRYIKGFDLDDDNKFKNFIKSKIVGKVMTVKE